MPLLHLSFKNFSVFKGGVKILLSVKASEH
jgi:hypothetical protein